MISRVLNKLSDLLAAEESAKHWKELHNNENVRRRELEVQLRYLEEENEVLRATVISLEEENSGMRFTRGALGTHDFGGNN